MRHPLSCALLSCLAVLSSGCAVEPGSDALADFEAEIRSTEHEATPDTFLIDFDFEGIGTVGRPATSTRRVPSGTIVDSLYPDVTFSCAVCRTGHAYARSFATSPKLNYVSLFGGKGSQPNEIAFHSGDGAVEVTFTRPMTTVTIDATPIRYAEGLGHPDALPWLEAYGRAGFLGRVEYPFRDGQPGWGSAQTLSISGDITRVRFSTRFIANSGYQIVYGLFDNLTFTPTIKGALRGE